MATGAPGEVGQLALQHVEGELKLDQDSATVLHRLMAASPVLAHQLKALPVTPSLVQHLEVRFLKLKMKQNKFVLSVKFWSTQIIQNYNYFTRHDLIAKQKSTDTKPNYFFA